MPDFTQIKLDIDGPIATITLYRPEKMNAFTHQMRDEIIEAIDITDADDAVRAVIVTGDGERAFCAGADLTPPKNADGTDKHVFSDPKTVDDLSDPLVRDGGGRLVLRLFNSQKPLIGACNGVAVGVGATMQHLPLRPPHPVVRARARIRASSRAMMTKLRQAQATNACRRLRSWNRSIRTSWTNCSASNPNSIFPRRSGARRPGSA